MGDLATNISIDFLSDVDTTTATPTAGQALVWSAYNKWEPATVASGSYANSDVDTHLNQTNPTSGYVLSWNGTDYSWVAPSAGGAYANSDVDTHLNQAGPTDGYVLSWTSGDYSWVAPAAGGAPQAFAGIAVTGQTQVIADGNADTLTFEAGAGMTITTDSATDKITFASAAGVAGADTQIQYNNSGAFGAEAGFTYNASTNTLSVPNLVATNITATGAGTQTITAGTNIELDATNRVLVTDTPFRLASFNTAGRDAIAGPTNGDMIYNTTTTQIESYENSAWGVIGLKSPTFAVSAPDSSAYQFNGAGTTADNNPTLYLRKGETYIFDMNSSGHPFFIQTSSGAYNAGNVYTDTITNSGAQSGIISWTIQMDTPATLYYVCQYHAAMTGTINIS